MFLLYPLPWMWSLSLLQVAVKNNIDVFYFSCQYPISMLFVEDGKMGECLLEKMFSLRNLLMTYTDVSLSATTHYEHGMKFNVCETLPPEPAHLLGLHNCLKFVHNQFTLGITLVRCRVFLLWKHAGLSPCVDLRWVLEQHPQISWCNTVSQLKGYFGKTWYTKKHQITQLLFM